MEYRGFVKYRLPGEEETVILNGFWKKTDHLQGFSNVDFVVANYDNSFYYVFHANDEDEKAEIELCYRSMDDESFLNYGAYTEKLKDLIEEIRSGKYQKVIFSRRKKVGRKVDPEAIFHKLNIQYQNSFNYLFGIENTGVWIGASPEVLIGSVYSRYQMHSLAGTLGRNVQGEYDWSEKEKEEQKYVTDYIIDGFEKVGITDLKLDGPSVFEHGRVAHLKTSMDFAATYDQINELLREIPPTPAVCGIPKEEILSVIQDLEGYDRRFYTGTIGVYKEGQIQLFVNLRCMEVFMNEACLYVGGGITSKSDPENEWDETEVKSQTLLDML